MAIENDKTYGLKGSQIIDLSGKIKTKAEQADLTAGLAGKQDTFIVGDNLSLVSGTLSGKNWNLNDVLAVDGSANDKNILLRKTSAMNMSTFLDGSTIKLFDINEDDYGSSILLKIGGQIATFEMQAGDLTSGDVSKLLIELKEDGENPPTKVEMSEDLRRAFVSALHVNSEEGTTLYTNPSSTPGNTIPLSEDINRFRYILISSKSKSHDGTIESIQCTRFDTLDLVIGTNSLRIYGEPGCATLYKPSDVRRLQHVHSQGDRRIVITRIVGVGRLP